MIYTNLKNNSLNSTPYSKHKKQHPKELGITNVGGADNKVKNRDEVRFGTSI